MNGHVMRRFLLSACIAGLTLSLSPQAFADDAESCDMLCRLRSYLATDHMAPASAGAGSPRASAKHTRSAAAPHRAKPGVAAAPAASVPKVAVLKPAPAAETAEARPKRPKTVSVADANPAPSPAPERHRSTAKAALHPAKSAVVARTAEPAAPEADATAPIVSKAPSKRVAAHVAVPKAPRVSSPPPVQTATAAEITKSPTAPIPGSAPLVAAGFK